MAQTQIFKGTARQRIVMGDGAISYKYHNTTIVHVLPNGHIRLDSGDYRTRTTKLAMNQASNEYSLGFQVYQRDGFWYVDYKGNTLDFVDGMILS